MELTLKVYWRYVNTYASGFRCISLAFADFFPYKALRYFNLPLTRAWDTPVPSGGKLD
jgi:hypothetical protein